MLPSSGESNSDLENQKISSNKKTLKEPLHLAISNLNNKEDQINNKEPNHSSSEISKSMIESKSSPPSEKHVIEIRKSSSNSKKQGLKDVDIKNIDTNDNALNSDRHGLVSSFYDQVSKFDKTNSSVSQITGKTNKTKKFQNKSVIKKVRKSLKSIENLDQKKKEDSSLSMIPQLFENSNKNK